MAPSTLRSKKFSVFRTNRTASVHAGRGCRIAPRIIAGARLASGQGSGARAEGVAGLQGAGLEAAAEPLLALGGGAVGERLRHHVALGGLLQLVVADGA